VGRFLGGGVGGQPGEGWLRGFWGTGFLARGFGFFPSPLLVVPPLSAPSFSSELHHVRGEK